MIAGLPNEILNQHIAVLGKTRSGKSSVMRLIVEGLLDAKSRCASSTPRGIGGVERPPARQGLRLPRRHLRRRPRRRPLNPHAGASVAELVATGNRPCIIDLGGWMVGERTRFYIDFASKLFVLTKGLRWLVVDEAHNFAPQGKILDPDAGKMLHWSNRLASEGLGKGLALIFASQRPQKVHKDFLTSAETLIAMRVIHPLDRGAVKEWIDGAGDLQMGKDVLASLASMQRGEGWVWSPEVGFGPKRVQFPMFNTFDSFRPHLDSKALKLRGWAAVDLEDVKAKLAQSIEEAKANDPAELKRQVADLRRQLAAKPAAVAPEVKVVEKPVVTKEQIREVETIVNRLEREGQKRIEAGDALKESGEQLKATARDFAAALRTAAAPPPPTSRPFAPTRPPPVPRPAPTRTVPPSDGILSGRQQKMLNAAATLATLGVEVSRETVCAWVGIHPRGGSVGEELKALSEAGMIVVDQGRIQLTELGEKSAEPVDPATAIDSARSGLSPRQTRIFDIVATAYPDGITREAIAEQMDIHPRGGSFGEDIGRLVGRGLVDNNRGVVRARDFLFANR
jgi:hypothetical protein